MTDKLEEIFSLQKSLTDMMNLERYPNDKDEKISGLCTAMIHEAIELQRLTNWKWWKKPTSFNEEEAREELIDIWHFLMENQQREKLHLQRKKAIHVHLF